GSSATRPARWSISAVSPSTPSAEMKRTEGNVPFREFQTWYRVVGEREDEGKLPLLLLHGGPGATHDYLESLEGMAETGRRAIFYDQLGCGKSDLPDDTSLWTVETFVEELGVVRDRKSTRLNSSHQIISYAVFCLK